MFGQSKKFIDLVYSSDKSEAKTLWLNPRYVLSVAESNYGENSCRLYIRRKIITGSDKNRSANYQFVVLDESPDAFIKRANLKAEVEPKILPFVTKHNERIWLNQKDIISYVNYTDGCVISFDKDVLYKGCLVSQTFNLQGNVDL